MKTTIDINPVNIFPINKKTSLDTQSDHIDHTRTGYGSVTKCVESSYFVNVKHEC